MESENFLFVLTACNINPLPAEAIHSNTMRNAGFVEGDIVERSAGPRIESALPAKTRGRRPVFLTTDSVSLALSERLLLDEFRNNAS